MVKNNIEIELMKIETRLDRIQNESRKALGDVRQILEYHKTNRQKTLVPHTIGHRAGKCKGVKRFRKEESRQALEQ